MMTKMIYKFIALHKIKTNCTCNLIDYFISFFYCFNIISYPLNHHQENKNNMAISNL